MPLSVQHRHALLLADRTHDVGVITTVVTEVLAENPDTNLLEIEQAFRDNAAAAYLVATTEGFEVVLGLLAMLAAVGKAASRRPRTERRWRAGLPSNLTDRRPPGSRTTSSRAQGVCVHARSNSGLISARRCQQDRGYSRCQQSPRVYVCFRGAARTAFGRANRRASIPAYRRHAIGSPSHPRHSKRF